MKKQILILILLLTPTIIVADNPVELTLEQGKSNFTINENFPSIYASQLMEQYPQIKSISINEYGQTYGYLNTLGGIGTNLLVEPTKNYEIFTNETLTIYLNP